MYSIVTKYFYRLYYIKNYYKREFPVGLMVRTWCFHYCVLGSIPGLGTEISHQAVACCSQKKKRYYKIMAIIP